MQTPRTAVAVRAEYYNDKQGVIITFATPHGSRAWGFSANFDYNITDNLLWRLEARMLRSNDDIFAGKNGTSRDSATFFTTSIVTHF
ncbi:outer membrane beta-barrel protein [Nitrosospira multiformis]|uniref:outer membrane beta-barrel protein n=1 Tax=Nitrosospira multiformis TaxID=1231 RepID=UPI000944823A|nr:outer membrane beta-barrel protein [Nitrosospira multiformis]